MKEPINFAWPVTSSNREDYEAFCNWLNKNKEIIKEEQLAIWGAGIRGTEFSLFLKKNNLVNIIFVDNNEQKWGGLIDEFPIISPEELYQKMANYKIRILISTENSSEIECQLLERGYKRDLDFFVIKSNLYKKYIDEFKREYSRDILILGDCEFSKISLKDKDLINLGEMIKKSCGEECTKVLAMHGMGIRAYYNILHAQIARNMKPKLLVIMINLDTLTGRQHLLPRSQHTELMQEIYDITDTRDSEFEEYIKIIYDRSHNNQAEFFVNKSIDGSKMEAKARNYFKLNYMYKLDENIEGLQYLNKLFEEAKRDKIEVIPFVPPVNFTLARKLLGEKFEISYTENIEKIRKIVESNQLKLLDMSYCLGADMFAEPDTPDETANEIGRKVINHMLYKEIKDMIDSKAVLCGH